MSFHSRRGQTNEQAEAAKLYTRRAYINGLGNSFMTKAGTPLGNLTRPSAKGPAVLMPTRLNVPKFLDVPHRWQPRLDRAKVLQCYVLSRVEIDGVAQLAEFFPDRSWPSTSFCALAVALGLSFGLMRMSECWGSVMQFGYLSIDYDHLMELFEEGWPEALDELEKLLPQSTFPQDAAALGQALQVNRSAVTPLRMGPALRLDGNLALFDLSAAAYELSRECSFSPEQGRLANVRSKHFELAVQRAIDATPWRPPRSLRRLIGKPLRHAGRAVTDLDAVATKNLDLIVVSAKSVLFTEERDKGTHKALRNAADTVVKACSEARRLELFLRKNPKGDNYDFSGFRSIQILVCLPYAIEVPLGAATLRLQNGLLAAVALGEFQEFLAGNAVPF